MNKWERKPRAGYWRSPWGWKIDPDNPRYLLPIVEHLEILELAKKYYKQHRPLREISAWITASTGSYISHEGLRKRIKRDNLAEHHEKRSESAKNMWKRIKNDTYPEASFEVIRSGQNKEKVKN